MSSACGRPTMRSVSMRKGNSTLTGRVKDCSGSLGAVSGLAMRVSCSVAVRTSTLLKRVARSHRAASSQATSTSSSVTTSSPPV